MPLRAWAGLKTQGPRTVTIKLLAGWLAGCGCDDGVLDPPDQVRVSRAMQKCRSAAPKTLLGMKPQQKEVWVGMGHSKEN